MTNADAATVEDTGRQTSDHPYYRISALAKGFIRAFRAFLPLLVVVLANALVQGFVTIGEPAPELNSPRFLIMALISLIALWLTLAWITASALVVADGRASFGDVGRVLRGRLWRFVAWTALIGVLATIGWATIPVLSLVVLALTPFVPFAALEVKGNPIAVNFRVIGRRFVRWLITVIIIGILSAIVWLLSALNTFFIGDAFGSFLAWLILGGICAWWFTAFGLVYRSATAGDSAKAAYSGS